MTTSTKDSVKFSALTETKEIFIYKDGYYRGTLYFSDIFSSWIFSAGGDERYSSSTLQSIVEKLSELNEGDK